MIDAMSRMFCELVFLQKYIIRDPRFVLFIWVFPSFPLISFKFHHRMHCLSVADRHILAH